MRSIVSNSIEDTEKIAKDWILDLGNKITSSDQATVVLLSGHLGAGKTAFTKSVAKEMGIEDVITSPTFVIMKIYDTNSSAAWQKLVHIDAYRLERGEEMEALSFEDVLSDPKNLVMIEWAENIQSALGALENPIKIKFSAVGENSRKIEFAD